MIGQLLDLAGGQHPGHRQLCGRAGLLVNDAKHLVDGAPHGIRDRPSGQTNCHGVHAGDAPGGICGHYRVADRLQRGGQTFLAFSERPLAGLCFAELAPDQSIGGKQHADEDHRDQRTDQHHALPRVGLHRASRLEHATLQHFHVVQNSVGALARLAQRSVGCERIGGLRALRLTQGHHAPGDRQTFVEHLAQLGPMRLLAQVIAGVLFDPAHQHFAGCNRFIPLGQAHRIARDPVALAAEFNLHRVGSDPGQAGEYLMRVCDPARRLSRIIGHRPGHGRECDDHQHGGAERGQHFGFKTCKQFHQALSRWVVTR